MQLIVVFQALNLLEICLGLKAMKVVRRPKLPPPVIDAIVTVQNATTENIEMQDLPTTADNVHESIENLATEMQEAGMNTDLGTSSQFKYARHYRVG